MNLKELVSFSYENAYDKGFWQAQYLIDKYGIEGSDANIVILLEYAAKIALVHSELSEMLEGLRRNDLDNVREESSDVLIRMGDLIGGMGHSDTIDQETEDKMAKNLKRPPKHNKEF